MAIKVGVKTGNVQRDIARPNGKDHFWQWDEGQRLLLTGFQAGTQVHFSYTNDDDTGAKPVVSYESDIGVCANVPRHILQLSGRLHVYVYEINGTEKHTALHKVFQVNAREKPDDYIYTPAEQQTWENLYQQINELKNLVSSGGRPAKGVKEIELLAADWQTEHEGKYFQVKEIAHVSESSLLQLTFDDVQLEILQDTVKTFYAQYENGATKIYVLGDKPTRDYTVQLTIEEVVWLE